jgi:hypothetical protein
MLTNFPRVLTDEEVAEALRSTPEAVAVEFETGRLRGFKIGDRWRMTLADLLMFLGAADPHEHEARLTRRTCVQDPVWRSIQIEWQKAEPFNFRWPSSAQVKGAVEKYSEAFEGVVLKNGRVHRSKKLLVGFTTRKAVGMENRRRSIVFLVRNDTRNGQPSLYPVVEFAGANDYETSQRLASLIKLPNRTHLRSGDPIPSDYNGFEIAVYSDVVIGHHAPNGLAVIVRNDDLDAMARHALLRLNGAGRIGRNFDFESLSE